MVTELTWADAADGATALQMITPELRALAATGTLAYEGHFFGVWLPDFLCAPAPRPAASPSHRCRTPTARVRLGTMADIYFCFTTQTSRPTAHTRPVDTR